MSNLDEKHKAVDEIQRRCDEQLAKTIEAIKKSKNNSQKNSLLLTELAKQQQCKNEAIDLLQKIQRIEQFQREANDLVNRRLDQCQTFAALTLAAVVSASNQYDNILQTVAKKPLIETVLGDIVVFFLPELKILERGFGRLIKEKSKSKDQIKELEKIIQNKKLARKIVKEDHKHMNKVRDKLKNAGEVMDRVLLKDTIQSVRGTISSNDDADAASQLRDIAFQAKNHIFQQAIASIMNKLFEYNTTADFFYEKIPGIDDQWGLNWVKSSMDSMGMEEINVPPNPGLYNLLSDQILYAMLRRYASRYCSITFTSYSSPYPSDTVKSDTNIDGLDKSQRRKIYDKFGSKVWKGRPEYPSVDNSQDLVRHWGVTVNRESYDLLKGRRKIEPEIA